MKTNTLYSASGLAIAAVLLIIVNIFAGFTFKSAKLDLTENNLYTVSDGTRSILSKLDEPITIRLFFSQGLLSGIPEIMNYGRRVQDLLKEYSALSSGKLNLILLDPEPFSDVEDQAVQYGLQGVPADNAGSLAYFGLVGTNATDDEEVIPFFQSNKEESLEYDLTKLIYKLTDSKQKVVGVISNLPIMADAHAQFMPQQQGPQDWMIIQQAKQLFELRSLDTEIKEIPSDIDLLLLVHPKQLPDETQFAIDQFVLNGGRAVVFVDPYAEADLPPQDPQNPMAAMTASRASNLEKLFNAWGVELVSNKIAADRLSATRVSVNAGARPQAIDYVAWLSLTPENFNKEDFITSDLQSITVGSAGILKKKDNAEIEFTPLLQTSDQAMELSTTSIQFGPNPAALLKNYKPGGAPLTIAAKISGKVKSAFPEGAPGKKESSENSEAMKESKDAINVMVVADTDILSDRFWVDVQNFFGKQIALPRANNDAFLINSVDNLLGSNDLISLRSRGRSSRPFTKVQELRLSAEKRFQDQEQILQQKLKTTEQKLAELQKQKEDTNTLILSDEQRQEIEKFRAEQVQTRKALRSVKHELNKNIEVLGSILKFVNIALVPIIVVVLAVYFGIRRVRRNSMVSKNA